MTIPFAHTASFEHIKPGSKLKTAPIHPPGEISPNASSFFKKKIYFINCIVILYLPSRIKNRLNLFYVSRRNFPISNRRLVPYVCKLNVPNGAYNQPSESTQCRTSLSRAFLFGFGRQEVSYGLKRIIDKIGFELAVPKPNHAGMSLKGM